MTVFENRIFEITDDEVLELLNQVEPEIFGHTNYQHTDYRCHYNPDTHTICAEEICKNEHGGVFGREVYYTFEVPANREVNWSGNWIDIEA